MKKQIVGPILIILAFALTMIGAAFIGNGMARNYMKYRQEHAARLAKKAGCAGLVVTFTPAEVGIIDNCIGWSVDGKSVSLPVDTEVAGGEGVCAITCYIRAGEPFQLQY